jgi:hypothetical protein
METKADAAQDADDRVGRAPAGPRAFSFVHGELRYGMRVALDAHFEPPPHEARLRRFLYGVALPFGIVLATLRSPDVRKRYLRITLTQVAVLVPLGVLFIVETDRVADAIDDEKRGALAATFAAFAAAVSLLSLVEWLIIALSRQYHELCAVMAAATTGAPWDELTAPPRVALDVKWLWKKMKRRVRGLVLFVSGLPLLAVSALVPILGDVLYPVLSALWGYYWVSVFALANTSTAWVYADPRGPWYVRAIDQAGAVPVVGWPFRLYARLLRRVARDVVPACTSFERAPYEAAGLAIARAVCGIPGVYLFMRPVLGVAASHAMVAASWREAKAASTPR